MIFLLFLLLFHVHCSPQLDCFLEDEKCEITPENLLQTFTGIRTVEECKTLCTDEDLCIAFTHFGRDSFLFVNDCLLFSSCTERRVCQDCITGSGQSECICSIAFSGKVGENNLVDIIPNVSSEHECKKFCISNDLCSIYSFYNNYDQYNPNLCVLLTNEGPQMPIVECDNCATGPGRCYTGQKCQAAVITNGTATQAIFAEKSMTVNMVASEQDCYVDLNVLAVGGGGDTTGWGGAGSGYIDTTTLRLTASNSTVDLKVGAPGEPSKVEVNKNVVLKAKPGKSTTSVDGADGYSGGGGYLGEGGFGGGDGEGAGYSPGKGSGLDLGLINMKYFFLSPGDGGLGNSYGGGGGGVVVDDKKPEDDGDRWMGQGYGGGGSHFNYSHGHAGLVLIEIQS